MQTLDNEQKFDKVGEIWDFCLCLLSHDADNELHWQATGKFQKLELFIVSYIHWAGDMIQGFSFSFCYILTRNSQSEYNPGSGQV